MTGHIPKGKRMIVADHGRLLTSEGWQGSTVSATFQVESCRRNVRLGPKHTFPAGSIPSREDNSGSTPLVSQTYMAGLCPAS